MRKQMGWSKIRYCGTGADGQPVDKYRAWNPCGYGCSKHCPGCWAELLAKRVGGAGCEKCKTFVPHLHPERLSQPTDTPTPAVVLSCFTADWLDRAHPPSEIAQILDAIAKADHHVFVTLTKNALNAARIDQCEHEYRGLTIRDQVDADQKLPVFLEAKGKLWLSLEPLWGAADLDCVYCIGECDDDGHPLSNLSGVVVGHDNRPGALGTDTLDHVRSVVKQCEAADVPVFVKQLHLWKCRCGKTYETRPGTTCRACLAYLPRSRKLCHDPAEFPEDLRRRDLPWSMPTLQETPCAQCNT